MLQSIAFVVVTLVTIISGVLYVGDRTMVIKKAYVLLMACVLTMSGAQARSIRDVLGAELEGPPAPGVTDLDLRIKNITSIDGIKDIARKYPNLQTLRLSNNQLKKLPVGVFNGLANLESLHLDTNQLQTLPVGAFNGLTSLLGLNLDNNQLQTLPVGVFNGLPKL